MFHLFLFLAKKRTEDQEEVNENRKKKKSKTTLGIKSFNSEEKSSKNEQMCQKKALQLQEQKGVY